MESRGFGTDRAPGLGGQRKHPDTVGRRSGGSHFTPAQRLGKSPTSGSRSTYRATGRSPSCIRQALTDSTPTDQSPTGRNDEQATVAESGTVLSQDLARFLIEFSIALHKHGIYPPHHPSLDPAVELVTSRLNLLLEKQGAFSLGAAGDQLVIEGVATDPANPVLRDLARRLHGHQLGGIRFSREATGGELRGVIAALAEDPDRTGEPLGRQRDDALQRFPHIRLYPISYARLQLADEAEDGVETLSQATQLWIGLAQAAMESGDAGDTQDTSQSTEPLLVAQAISEHPESTAYDQVVVGYLMTIAEELKTTGGAGAQALRRRMAKLMSALESDALERLLAMGGDRAQRHRFLKDAADGMEEETVLSLLNAASKDSDDSISDHMLRMLEKMARHSTGATGARREFAEHSVREQVTELISGWSLKTPISDSYSTALRQVASERPAFQAFVAYQYAEPRRIVQMAMEVDTPGPIVSQAVRHLMDEDTVWLLKQVTGGGRGRVSQEIRKELANPAQLTELLNREDLDPLAIAGWVELMGEQGIDPLLDALANAESSQVRRRLLDALSGLGPTVGAAAIKRLDDSRWYVQRNMLNLLGQLDDLPAGFDAEDLMNHEDVRIRREAVRVGIEMPSSREKGVLRGLADTDERIIRLALAAATPDCPAAAIPLVASCAATGPGELRVMAVRALGGCSGRVATQALLDLTRPKRKLLHWKHPAKTPEYLEALRALRHRADDLEVKDVLRLASQRTDHDIVAASTGETSDG